MINPSKQRFNSISGNRFFIILLSIYFFLLLILSYLACFFSYQQKEKDLLSRIHSTYVQLEQSYNNILDNFWQIYMPIVDSKSYSFDILNKYFNIDADTNLNPFEKNELTYAAQQILMRDNNIQWLVLYNPNRNDNYILYNAVSSLEALPTDFPYYEELNSNSAKMEIYRMTPISNSFSTFKTFTISGNVPKTIGTGKIMVGYSIAPMEHLCHNASIDLKTLNFVLTNNDEILFDSSGQYNSKTYCSKENFSGINTTSQNQRLYLHSETCGLKTSYLSYYVSWWELFTKCHIYTPLLLGIVIIFAIVSVVGYTCLLHMINKEVSVIRNGLEKIGENNLDYQIPSHFNQSGLPEIAQSINHMTVRLKQNINKAYYYELRQKESELSELQSKFNPHFLYNTLEMLRSRCHQNGDNATAELITQLSAIFRGFIGNKTFVPMLEELTSSKRYLALFGARYEDKVTIRYDFDKDILKYGIIRNLFQPLIENYFIHGFDTSNTENYILFRGKSLDDKTILLTVEDNGSGMAEKDIEQLNAQLHAPIKLDTESYGLKNLHQRLHLFYGGECGLTIYPNPNAQKGLCIQMTALKITCEEYEAGKRH